MQKKKITVAIVGNPNCGKTVLFNALTGSHQHVGNWSGVTVEKKTGVLELDDFTVEVVDLPGIYALYASSEDERVALQYLLSKKADLVINILDASNLERNLFLTTQLMEMQVPVILALNMMDVAISHGIHIDSTKLSELLGIPAIGLSAVSPDSCKSFVLLLEKWLKAKKWPNKKKVDHLPLIEQWIQENAHSLHPVAEDLKQDLKTTAIQFLEGNACVVEKATPLNLFSRDSMESFFGEEPEFVLANSRYAFIKKVTTNVLQNSAKKSSFTDKLDRFVLNRFLSIPVFIVVMYLVFWVAITIGSAFIDFFDVLFGAFFVDGFSLVLEKIGAPGFMVALLADGLGAGIQTVATFIPVIFFMFLTLSFLEDSGYMARAAFIVDRFMRFLGLPGKAFVPMLVGFGCSVPALMGTRTMENKRERFLTLFLIPFMSCGARLPVYALFGAAFFGSSAGNMVFAIYLIGILIAVLYGLLLRHTLFKGESAPFIMELPSYHFPKMKSLLRHSWYKLRQFIVNAGRIVLLMVTILGFIGSIGVDGSFGNGDSKNSVLSHVGKTITPIFTPFGVEEENWSASVALFTGLFAKEAVVGTLNSLYSINESSEEAETEEEFSLLGSTVEAFSTIPENLKGIFGALQEPLGVTSALEEGASDENSGMLKNIRSYFSLGKHQAFAYLLFILLYVPCLAALGTAFRELGRFYGTVMMVFQMVLSWSVAVLYFQITLGKSMLWISVSIALLLLMSLSFWFIGKQQKKEFK
jgi:ferrous iron transport protein B